MPSSRLAAMKTTIPAATLHSAMVEIGRRGGKARAKNASKKRLSEIGRQGAAARWRKGKKHGRV